MKYALTAIAVAAMASSQAAILIDHFDDPVGGQSWTITNPVGAVGPNSSALLTGLTDVLGGARQLYVGTTTGAGSSKVTVGANVDPDRFTLATDSTTIDSYGGVIWNGGVQGGLNANLSECKIIRWDSDNDQTTIYSVKLSNFGPGGGSATYQILVPASAGVTTHTAPLSFFSGAGINLADVDQIELKADPTVGGGDVAIHLIECDIPEPATTGVAFAALAGLGMVIRRFRKA